MQYVPPLGASDPNASYVEGNPLAGIRGSFPTAAGYEAIMREIVNAETALGQTPDPNNFQQLAAAILLGGKQIACVDASTADGTYLLTPTPPISAYMPMQSFVFVATRASVGASLINVGGKGAIEFARHDNSPLEEGDIVVGDLCRATYDGTAVRLELTIGQEPAAPAPQPPVPPQSIFRYVSVAGSPTALVGSADFPPSAYIAPMPCELQMPNFGTLAGVTLALRKPDGTLGSADPILRNDGTPVVDGDILPSSTPIVVRDGSQAAWRLVSIGAKQVTPRLASSPIWVRSDGSDAAADGSANTPAKAFATLAAAIAYVGGFDTAGMTPTFELGVPGTYAAPTLISNLNCRILGDDNNPGNYIIAGAGSASQGGVTNITTGGVVLEGVTYQNTGSVTAGIAVTSGGALSLVNTTVVAQQSTNACIEAGPGGAITVGTGCSFIAAAGATVTQFWLATGGSITLAPVATTFTGACTRTINSVNQGQIQVVTGGSAGGSVTGSRYSVSKLSIIACGGSATFWPGTTAGSVDAPTFGVYD